MLELFRKHLKPTSKEGSVIQQCIPLRFRWRADGSRCVLQYVLNLRGEGNQCSKLYVALAVYADASQAEVTWKKQAVAGGWRLIPRTAIPFEPLTFIPELKMLAYVFPYDRLLPSLPELIRGPWPELQRPLLASFGPGQWQLEQQFTETLRYRIEDSAVFRYTLHGHKTAHARTETRRFYAKAYRTSYGEQIAQILRQLHQRTGGTQSGFTVVEPLFYCPERLSLVLAEAPGHSLQEALMRGSQEQSLTSVRGVARALAAFNQSQISTNVRHSAEQQIQFLERAAVLLRWACPASSPVIEHIVQTVREGLRDVAQVPIHWDLKTDHIFLQDGRVTFVDLDTVSFGAPARDPAHLAAHLACRIDVPGMAPGSARDIAAAFVEEYFSQVPASWRKQFQLQFLIAVVEGACGLFKRQEPAWAERTVAALVEAERCLPAVWV